MARQESKNYQLKETTENRASMRDLNGIRPTNYLSGFLERVTDDVKIPKHHVKSIQQDKEFMESQDFDCSTMMPNSLMISSNKASFNIKMGSVQPGRLGMFPSLVASERTNSINKLPKFH
mmetsp:Transcript_17103/g.23041  ORF Transcript_17103/g.23041 Transcript_17103/m.23041 type:complete len:120 (+) Transcript_17103:205-564(+)